MEGHRKLQTFTRVKNKFSKAQIFSYLAHFWIMQILYHSAISHSKVDCIPVWAGPPVECSGWAFSFSWYYFWAFPPISTHFLSSWCPCYAVLGSPADPIWCAVCPCPLKVYYLLGCCARSLEWNSFPPPKCSFRIDVGSVMRMMHFLTREVQLAIYHVSQNGGHYRSH